MCEKKFILTFFFFLISLATQAKEKAIQIDEQYRQFLTDYCTKCHNAKKTKGKVRLDTKGFSFAIKTVKDADIW